MADQVLPLSQGEFTKLKPRKDVAVSALKVGISSLYGADDDRVLIITKDNDGEVIQYETTSDLLRRLFVVDEQ